MDLILYFLVLIIPVAAHFYVWSTYSKYKQVANSKAMCGQEIARNILDENGLENVHVVEVRGNLSDHYDPNQKVVRLSTEVFHGESVAALAVAAHECGHAIQDKENYTFMRIRASLVHVVNLVTYSALIVLLASVFLQMLNYTIVAIALYLITLVFQLVTLPVEFDASKRALQQIEQEAILEGSEYKGGKQVLTAAALTYVASVASTLLEILRLILLFTRRRDD